MNSIIQFTPSPNDIRDYNDDVSVYGKEASLEKLCLTNSLRTVASIDNILCDSIVGIWFAVVFLGCIYPDDVLLDTARCLLLVPDRCLRYSACRRFVNALECDGRRREVDERIRNILP